MDENDNLPLYETGGRYQEDIARTFGRYLAVDAPDMNDRPWDDHFEAEARRRFEQEHPNIVWESVRDLIYDAWVQHTESRFIPGPRPYYNPEQLNDGERGEENRRITDGDSFEIGAGDEDLTP